MTEVKYVINLTAVNYRAETRIAQAVRGDRAPLSAFEGKGGLVGSLGITKEQKRMVIVLLAGAVLVVLNQTLLSPALPSIMRVSRSR